MQSAAVTSDLLGRTGCSQPTESHSYINKSIFIPQTCLTSSSFLCGAELEEKKRHEMKSQRK